MNPVNNLTYEVKILELQMRICFLIKICFLNRVEINLV